MTEKGDLTSTPLADNIIAIIIENIHTQMDLTEFELKEHRLNDHKFWEYVKLSLYWGYNFAKELLNEVSELPKAPKVSKTIKN